MRQRRAKLYRKMLHAYQLQFGFREPYQLLIDDTFSLALSRYKISDPLNQFSNVLQSKKIKPLITQCCMQALYALGKQAQSTVDMAKQWERRMCNHRDAIDPQRCIKECVGDKNKHRYIVASEQGELRRDLRLGVAGLPMMHFTQAVMVLEPMSPLTKSKIEEKEEQKLSLPLSEAALLKSVPNVELDIVGAAANDAAETDAVEAGQAEANQEAGSRRRKRKAPNPLSVRKPKTPRLSMDDKLQREQELKKQKQRAAARARLQASSSNADNAQGATTPSARKKRRRSSTTKNRATETAQSGSSTPAPATDKKSQSEQKLVAAETNGQPRNKRRTRSHNAANNAKPVDGAPAEPVSA